MSWVAYASAAIVSDAGSPYDPENSYYAVLTGNGDTVNRVMQTVKIENGKKGDIYTLGAWGKAHSVSTNTAADAPVTATTFGLRAVFYNGTSIVGERCVSFNPHVYEWQLAAGEIIAPDDYTAIKIHLEYNYNANTAYFTQPYLYCENFGVSYTYDDNGNVTSTEDLAKQESTYDYDENDQLTSTLNSTGSRFLYAYEGKTSPTTVLSTSGMRYTPTYDGKGNVVSSSVTPYSPVLTPEPGVVYYILNAKTGEAIQYFTVEGAEQSEIFTSTFADGNTSAYWTLQAAGENTYRLVSHGNTYLSVSDGLNFDEQPLVSGNTANAASAFRFVLQEDGTFGIFTTLSGETHCVESAADADYPDIQRVQLGDCDENALTSAQRWYIYETTPDSDLKILAEMTYTADGNLPATVTDALGNTTTYDYDTVKGLLDEYTDALGNKTAYTYNANNDALQSVTASGQTVSYTYDGADRLATITTANGTVYTIVYDARGRNTQVKVGDVALSTLTYDTHDRLTQQSYASGAYITFEYDDLDRLVKKTYHSGDATQTLEYYYNAEGRLSIVIDSAENTTLRYRYDLSGRVAEEITYTGATPETTKQRAKTAYTYDEENGQITDVADTTPMGSATQKLTYGNAQNGEMPDTVYAVESTNSLLGNKQEKLTYTYDEFGRIATRIVYIRVGTASETELTKTTTYTYMQGGHGANSTSTQIATETTDGVTKSYTYDALGNIKTVSKNGVLQESYEYDSLSQLTKVTYANGDVYEYSYTVNGNITETKKNGEVIKTYTYGNTAWKDQLTAINGDSISYDEVGNPTFYYGDNQYFEWENGRRPTAVYNTNGTVTFGYASDGSRISKTVNGTTTTYYYAGGVLYGEQTGYNKLVYLYDESGTPYGFVYNDSPYYYDKNLQGDVTGIWNKNGIRIANYTYDAWGNVTSIINQYGEDVTSQPRHMGNLNPLRYRGYYYDAELELYWLNTRFYDPNLGRFVNADGVIAGVNDSVQGYNQYAYCFNNPVNCEDSTGCWPKLIQVVVDALDRLSNQLGGALGTLTAKLADKLIEIFSPKQASGSAVEFITSYESFSATAYDDGLGNMTIGYGHVIQKGESFGTLTQSEALDLFAKDLSNFEGYVVNYSMKNRIVWDQNQFDALVSVAYNSGENGMINIADKIIGGWDVQQAFTCIYSQEGALQGGAKLGLWRRRMDECDIFMFGSYEREYRQP